MVRGYVGERVSMVRGYVGERVSMVRGYVWYEGIYIAGNDKGDHLIV